MSVDSTIKQIQQLKELLPEANQNFIPARTDNYSIPKKKSKARGDYSLGSADQIELFIKNSTHYQNVKISPNNILGKEHSLILIDVDDHNDSGTSISAKDIQKVLNLPDTLTINTKSGKGFHLWYSASNELASRILKTVVKSSDFPNVEFFIFNQESNRTLPAPGSYNHDQTKQYKISNAITPQSISIEAIDYLERHAKEDVDKYSSSLMKNAHHFKTAADEQQNKIAFINYLNAIVMPYETLEKEALDNNSGRDDFIFKVCAQGATYNLGQSNIFDLVHKKIYTNESVISTLVDIDYDGYLETKVESAFQYILNLKRQFERSINSAVEEYKRDEFGHPVITLKQYEDKVEYVSKRNLRLLDINNPITPLKCETVVQYEDSFYVPYKYSIEAQQREYQNSMAREERGTEQIDFRSQLRLLSETALSWTKFKRTDFKESYSLLVNGNIKSLANHAIFKANAIQPLNISKEKSPTESIFYHDTFYMYNDSAILPLNEELYTKEIKAKIEVFFNKLINRIVAPDNQKEEQYQFLARYAKLLQDTKSKTDNVMILHGNQGTGKTSVIELLMYLFPQGDTTIMLGLDEFATRFKELKRLTHLDDIPMDMDREVLANIKAITTSDTQSFEAKGKDRVHFEGSVNLSMSTNEIIEERELISGRRFTIFSNSEPVNRDEIHRQTRQIFKELKANNWFLFRAMKNYLLEFDHSKFESNYKTPYQRNLINTGVGLPKVHTALVNMIANKGYVKEFKVFEPGKSTNRSDMLVALKYYYYLDKDREMQREFESYGEDELKGKTNSPTGLFRGSNVFDIMFTDCSISGSKILPLIFHTQYTYNLNSWDKVIEAIAILEQGNKDESTIQFIKDKYVFDSATKEELGTYNLFDKFESNDSSDDDFDPWEN